ncbi:MAG: protein-export chaperone SecB [Chitinophagales bacterium]
MENIKEQARLKFYGVDIVDVNFNIQKKRDDNLKVAIDIKPKVFYPKNSAKQFKIIMATTLVADGYFHLNLTSIGSFELNKIIDEKMKQDFININAPAIMFPYVRAFIATLTTNLGSSIGSITIPPHFFPKHLEEVNQNTTNLELL